MSMGLSSLEGVTVNGNKLSRAPIGTGFGVVDGTNAGGVCQTVIVKLLMDVLVQVGGWSADHGSTRRLSESGRWNRYLDAHNAQLRVEVVSTYPSRKSGAQGTRARPKVEQAKKKR